MRKATILERIYSDLQIEYLGKKIRSINAYNPNEINVLLNALNTTKQKATQLHIDSRIVSQYTKQDIDLAINTAISQIDLMITHCKSIETNNRKNSKNKELIFVINQFKTDLDSIKSKTEEFEKVKKLATIFINTSLNITNA